MVLGSLFVLIDIDGDLCLWVFVGDMVVVWWLEVVSVF